MNQTKSIMIVGVGGQGTLLASRILGHVFTSQGVNVKVSEVHGMSQRGGSVVTYVKYGDKVYSPVVTKGEADWVIAFEQLEAARFVSYLKPQGKLIVSTQRIDPMPVITGAAVYPEDIIEKIKGCGIAVIAAQAQDIAKELGNVKASNVVLMGVLSGIMDLSEDIWNNAISACVPERFLELNLKAFKAGRALITKEVA